MSFDVYGSLLALKNMASPWQTIRSGPVRGDLLTALGELIGKGARALARGSYLLGAGAPAPKRRFMSTSVKLKVLVVDESTPVHEIFAEMAEGSPIPFEVMPAKAASSRSSYSMATGRL